MQRGALALGVIGAAFAAAAPVHAQSSSNAEASVSIVQVFSVTRTRSLEFGRVKGAGQPGSVVIDPTTNAVTDVGPGGSRLVGGGPARSRAEFSLSGQPGRNYHVTLPANVVIPGVAFNSDVPIALTADNFTAVSAGGGPPVQLNVIGQDTVYVGATLHVPTNAPNGVYTLALVMTADYD